MKSELLNDPFPAVTKTDAMKPPQLAPARAPEADSPLPAEGAIDAFFDDAVAKLRTQAEKDPAFRPGDSSERRQHWQGVLMEAEKLRRRLSQEPRVCYFDFSSDHEEISVKLAASGNDHGIVLILSRHHPDTRELPPLEYVWLRQIGEPDAIFDKPLDGLREMALRVAQRLV